MTLPSNKVYVISLNFLLNESWSLELVDQVNYFDYLFNKLVKVIVCNRMGKEIQEIWVCNYIYIYYYKVEERLIPVEDLLDADEVFCTGTAVIVNPVGSVTYNDKRYLKF